MNTNLNTITATPTEAIVERTAASFPAVIALVFGVFMVFGAGMAQSSTLHNAAHDARHAFSFPCH